MNADRDVFWGPARQPVGPPSLGGNLVRFVYLDEAGISQNETALAVAGIIMHGDQQSSAVQKKLNGVIAEHIPEADRMGFVFHATDIYHGSRYFHRDRWPLPKRMEILSDLAAIIEEFHLPVVVAVYIKELLAEQMTLNEVPVGRRAELMQSLAVMDCAVLSQRWLETYTVDENAVIVAEDADRVKNWSKD